ncbi:unnamed protein product [Nyctereutes procyonoides]|uniref:(raccoon dog) hypothetical protein n=1 Tax=Nyctereutes procyonoides TaxID=34880 RepID=A0A811ZUG2_NYCPR|nr:unnamed protein product [Nyctereutes procyonoides]
MAKEKPKEGIKTEKNDHINLKVMGQICLQCNTPAQLEMEEKDTTDGFQH